MLHHDRHMYLHALYCVRGCPTSLRFLRMAQSTVRIRPWAAFARARVDKNGQAHRFAYHIIVQFILTHPLNWFGLPDLDLIFSFPLNQDGLQHTRV